MSDDIRKYAIDCAFYHISKALQTPDLVNTLCSLYLSDRVSFNSLKLYRRSFEGNISPVLRQYEMVLSLKWMSTSTHPDIMLVYLALQHSLDLSHLVVLSKFSDHSLLPIFLLLSNLLGSINRDIFHCCFNSASEKYAQTSEPFISDWLTVDEHTLGLLSKIPDEYRLWLLQFLLSPSRAKKYSLQEQHYKYVILVLLEVLYCPPSTLKVSLRTRAEYVLLIERIFPALLPKTSPSQKVADALRNMASETPLSDPLKKEVQKYLRRCKNILPWIDVPGVSTSHESLPRKLGRKLGGAMLRVQKSHERLFGRSD
ncbi:hypothetical protein BDQ12DRAFT_398399 [Crucibulum laeve]|uniref:Uncharacterized protein n=1 Tax=Crucibulum laeve TaxID=68775 RepID=A0A5C3LM45_9AGAR|nr:hypothetical protein BDQ12DRAFT_398399 [Crucibulum laeve]